MRSMRAESTKVSEGEALTLDLLLAEGPVARAWASRTTVEAGSRRLSVVSRLRRVSELRDLCLALGRVRRVAP